MSSHAKIYLNITVFIGHQIYALRFDNINIFFLCIFKFIHLYSLLNSKYTSFVFTLLTYNFTYIYIYCIVIHMLQYTSRFKSLNAFQNLISSNLCATERCGFTETFINLWGFYLKRKLNYYVYAFYQQITIFINIKSNFTICYI